jgi:hypothetical protein
MNDCRALHSHTAFAPSPANRGGLGWGALDLARVANRATPFPTSPCKQGKQQSYRRAKS